MMDHERVRDHLETLLASATFARSERARELLRYVVEEALDGRGDAINSKTLAQDVFGRGTDFDASGDPLVRVQMGRTRALLKRWYEDEGSGSALRIDIPKGGYRPFFVAAGDDAPSGEVAGFAPPAPDTPQGRRAPTELGTFPEGLADRFAEAPARAGGKRQRLRVGPAYLGAAALLALVGGLVASFAAGDGGPGPGHDYPVLIVRPFENMTGDASNDGLEEGFQRQIASDLQRFRTVRIALADEGAGGSAATDGEPDYAVAGTILSVTDELDVVLTLTDLASGDVVTRERFRRRAEDGTYFDVLADLSSRATGRLLGEGGGVERREKVRIEAAMGLPTPAEMASFRCIVLFDELTNAKTPERLSRAHTCLSSALERRGDDASLLAAMAWTTALAAPESGQVDAGPWADALTLDGARRLAARAVAIEPGNDFAHQHLGLIEWRLGRKKAAISSLRRAAALNPGSPGHLADLGLFLGFSGRWDEAVALVARAKERSGSPPSWYDMPLFYRALIEGDGPEAVRVAELTAASGDPFSPVYRLAAAVTNGDAAGAAALVPAVRAIAEAGGGDALRDARPWIRSDEVLDALEARLGEAGIRAVQG